MQTFFKDVYNPQRNPATNTPPLGFQDGAAVGLPPQDDACELVREAAKAKGQLGIANIRLAGIQLAPAPTDEDIAIAGMGA